MAPPGSLQGSGGGPAYYTNQDNSGTGGISSNFSYQDISGTEGAPSYYPSDQTRGAGGSSVQLDFYVPPQENRGSNLFERIAWFFQDLFDSKPSAPMSGIGSMMGCTSTSNIGAPASTLSSPKRIYESQVCYGLPQAPLDSSTVIPTKSSFNGCFYGTLKPLNVNESSINENFIKEFSRDIGRRSNGKYDMILKDKDGDLFHLVAQGTLEALRLASAISDYERHSGKYIWVTINGEYYEILKCDQANGDLKRAQKWLEREIYEENCVKPIVRVATPMNPLPKDHSYESIREYCIGQFQSAYDVNKEYAYDLFHFFYFVPEIMEEGMTQDDILKTCQNPPQEVGFTVDRCDPHDRIL